MIEALELELLQDVVHGAFAMAVLLLGVGAVLQQEVHDRHVLLLDSMTPVPSKTYRG